MDGKSLNIAEEKLNGLKEVLPEAFTEGKIDLEKLKAALGENIEFKNERYVLNWAGKSDAFRVLQSPSTSTLIPVKGESVNFDETDNLFIDGENLEVLKILQKSYFGKIKMIYIDPPYNTGNDKFIYPDKFSETKEEYLSRIGDKDDSGYMTREGLFRTNSKDSGHYHSNWLSMMYPRLFLARNLLKDNGVIFISIGAEEVSNLMYIMDEIFGEENKLAIISRMMKSGGNKGDYFSPNIDYILIYSKNLNYLEFFRIPLEDAYTNKIYNKTEISGDKKGKKYREMGLYQAGLDVRANQQYWIKCPDESFVIPPGTANPPKIEEGSGIAPEKGDGVWRWIYETYKKELDKGNIVFKKTRKSSLVNEKKRHLRGTFTQRFGLTIELKKVGYRQI